MNRASIPAAFIAKVEITCLALASSGSAHRPPLSSNTRLKVVPQAVVALQLRPQAAIGGTWAASTSPALTATLTPARPGHTLRLTDALSRTVWQAAVSVGHTALAVPLVGQPVGCYLLHLSGADGTTATWKLNYG